MAQGAALGNSEFLDDRLEPHRDQWSYLASIPKICKRSVLAELDPIETPAVREELSGSELGALSNSQRRMSATGSTVEVIRRAIEPRLIGGRAKRSES